MYSSTLLKHKFKVLVIYLLFSISILCNFILLSNYNSQANIVLFTPLNLSDNFSDFSDHNFSYPSCPVKTMYLHIW